MTDPDPACPRWDYLVLTASNDRQAASYESQVALRRRHGMLSGVTNTLVVPDLENRRIGSGGSTLLCLQRILSREARRRRSLPDPLLPAFVQETLSRLRILILHAGGDSRRLPAYGPCGKLFVPVPEADDSPIPCALFDRLLQAFLPLPEPPQGRGQTVVASGDALLLFKPAGLRFDRPGVTALACRASAEEAGRHGVFCVNTAGGLERFLQKPSPAQQAAAGALDAAGRSLLDVGVMSLDGAAATAWFLSVPPAPAAGATPGWREPFHSAILAQGLDFYRELCCALGTGTGWTQYLEAVRSSGSHWKEPLLRRLYEALHPTPCHVRVLPRCRFLHFGASSELIESGYELLRANAGRLPAATPLVLTCSIGPRGSVSGARAWVEACRIRAPLTLAGRNVVIGLDIAHPLSVPTGACLDLSPGRRRTGEPTWFVRPYGVDDNFKTALSRAATFCGQPLADWLQHAGLSANEIWTPATPPAERSLWNARVFPAEARAADYRRWLWMWNPALATDTEKYAFRNADRYSAEETASLANHAAFHARRRRLHRASMHSPMTT